MSKTFCLAVATLCRRLLPLVTALLALGSVGAAHAVNVSTFYTFDAPEYFSQGGVVQAADGSLFTLASQPTNALLRFAPDGTVTRLPITGYESAALSGPLLLGTDGNFYGVILTADTTGSLFRVTPAGVLTILHDFTGNGDDGGSPQPGLVQGTDGALYGMTAYQSNFGSAATPDAGTIFRCPLDGTLTTLHRFPGGANAPVPFGPLTADPGGSLYGFASGVLFRLGLDGGYTVLHDFTFGGFSGYPNPGFARDAAGNYYGTTRLGGSKDPNQASAGRGTVFRFTPDGGVTTLRTLDGDDGFYPVGPLTTGVDGNVYGVLSDAGDDIGIDIEEGGGILRITPAGEVSTVYRDHMDTGLHYAPTGLTRAADGSLYAATLNGVLRFVLTGPGSVGCTNDTFLAEAGDGFACVNFYRLQGQHGAASLDYRTVDDTAHAGTDYTAASGTVQWADGDTTIKTVRIPLAAIGLSRYPTKSQFTLQLKNPGGGADLLDSQTTVIINHAVDSAPGLGVSPLFTFSDGVDGGNIRALFPQADGSLIAATTGSGPDGDQGTIVRFDPDGSLRVLANRLFLENAAVTQGRDGNFYGTQLAPSGHPTIYRLAPDGTQTPLYDLGPSESSDIYNPSRTLLLARDGGFYGAVEVEGDGTKHRTRLFHVGTDGVLTNLHDLPGNDPVSLLDGIDGQLYGLRAYDAAHHSGFAFRVSPAGDYQVLHDFATDGGGAGRPFTPFFQGSNGRFYGLANGANGSDQPVFYQLKRNGKVKVLHTFINQEGVPASDFSPGGDGNFYGTISSVAEPAGTTLYRLNRQGEWSSLVYTGQAARNLQLLARRAEDGAAFCTDVNDARYLFRLDTVDAARPAVTLGLLYEGASMVNGRKAHAVVTRTGNLDAPLTLTYTVGGTARPGIDYRPLPGSVTILAGHADARITIKPYPLSINAPVRTSTLDLQLTPTTDDSFRLPPEGAKVEFTITGPAS